MIFYLKIVLDIKLFIICVMILDWLYTVTKCAICCVIVHF